MTNAEIIYWVDKVIDEYIFDDIEDELNEVKNRVHELIEKEQYSCNNWCPRYQRAWRLGYERGIYNATMEDGFAPVGWYVLTNDEVKEVNKKIMEKIKHKRLKQGKWYSNGLGTAVYCSMCESASPYRFDYCPYCGADMRGDDNDE